MDAPGHISLRGLSFRYEGPPVLQEVDLDVPRGGFHTLIGPSGCGKSTLLRLIAGLLEPTEGTVSVDGAQPGPGASDTGFIFQEPTLMPWLTVRENIALPLRLRHTDKAERNARAAALAERVGLGEFLSYYPRELSGGMKMRVSLARALALAPRLMLLDEPFAGLDAIRRDQLNEALLAVQQQEQWTALLVTHSVPEAIFLSSRVYVMSVNPGRIERSFDVPLPYPRTPALRSDPRFQSLVGEVLAALREVLPL